jgi:hypothetical protein
METALELRFCQVHTLEIFGNQEINNKKVLLPACNLGGFISVKVSLKWVN